MKMRGVTPGTRTLFEGLVVVSFVLTIAQSLLQAESSFAVNDTAIALTKLFIGPLIGLALAFAVSRLRSVIAAVLYLVLMIIAVLITASDIAAGDPLNLIFIIGLVAVICDVAAALIIMKWIVGRREVSA
ncbi:hypothetical protein [Aquisalinus flavus]|uniref:Uncharacterized protein n=1 Tax=Aquisalinus flavus TaxID=1526572 RepID=A0A8J2V171_9PROT|nr:hypothetical protein [Aquisalinus flavus]MBD0427546.1 hypothetical protein [Aquisalinus flavus]UNE47339.1 hypothetical protein FF099_04320 [Aquisalinus flavus]GGD01806.1 hypothetical protein GCM10011342_08590 [Aquisalinus flavus]